MKAKIKPYLIEDYMQKNNLTEAEFCKLCKISSDECEKMLNFQIYGEAISVILIYKVAHAMGLNFYELAE